MARSPPRTGPASAQQQKRARGALPSASDIVAFIRDSPSAVGTREIARAFDRPTCRPAGVARHAAPDRALGSGDPRRRPAACRRPAAARGHRRRTHRHRRGRRAARPTGRLGRDPTRRRSCASPRRAVPRSRMGARAAARLVTLESGEIEARIIRRLDPGGERVVGVFQTDRDGGRVMPADRRNKTEYRVAARDAAGAVDGELVVAEILPAARFGLPRARIVERLGAATDPGAISLLAIASFDIPTEFPPCRARRGRGGIAGQPGRAHRSARPAIGHDRRQRRPRFRRRGVGRARSRPGQCRRLASRRRDRRRRLVCAPRQRARPRGRAARQFGLFSRPRRADAARGAVERAVLAEARGRARLPRGRSRDRRRRPQAPPPLHARDHALGRAPDL